MGETRTRGNPESNGSNMLEIDSQILLAAISRIKSQLVPINNTRDADARTCQDMHFTIFRMFCYVFFW